MQPSIVHKQTLLAVLFLTAAALLAPRHGDEASRRLVAWAAVLLVWLAGLGSCGPQALRMGRAREPGVGRFVLVNAGLLTFGATLLVWWRLIVAAP